MSLDRSLVPTRRIEFDKLEFVLLAFVKRKVMEVHSSSRGSCLMIQDKLLCSGVEAQIYHGRKGKQIPNRKYQIQRKHIASWRKKHNVIWQPVGLQQKFDVVRQFFKL